MTVTAPMPSPDVSPQDNLAPVTLYALDRQRARIETRLSAGMDRVLDHGQFILGPEVTALEAELAGYCGVPHAIGVSSGRDALIMALMALDIGSGDAVFVPAFTFSATAGSVASVGAVPVFVDVDVATFNMDPAALETAIANVRGEGRLQPKAVMPVDLYGLPANYEKIGLIAAREGFHVIADAAQSLGGAAPAGPVGSLAPISAVSFYPTKPLGAYGDGGAVLTNDDGLAETVREIRSHGRSGAGDEALRLGMTGRLDTLQAAVLLAKFEVFADEMVRRQQIAERYTAGLADVVSTPDVAAGFGSAWALYTVRVADRDRVRKDLSDAGIQTGLFYPTPLHRHGAFQPWVSPGESHTVAEQLSQDVLSLPIYPDLTDSEADRVIAALRAVI
jgi:dTDP-4-amino-4,6-dideoxygalactose transaminase